MHTNNLILIALAVSGIAALPLVPNGHGVEKRQSLWHGDPFNEDDIKETKKRQSLWHGDPFNEDDIKETKKRQSLWHGDPFNEDDIKDSGDSHRRRSVWHGDPLNDAEAAGNPYHGRYKRNPSNPQATKAQVRAAEFSRAKFGGEALPKNALLRAKVLRGSKNYGVSKEFAFYHGADRGLE